MKTIFIAVDFSTHSKSIIKYGMSLAQAMKARIVLFHVFQTAATILEANALLIAQELKLTAEDALKKEAYDLLSTDNQVIETIAVEGVPDEMILLYANKYPNCFIICGMKLEGRLSRSFFGTTVTLLARTSNLPIIIVPEEYEFKNIAKIALASEFDLDTDTKTLEGLKLIGEAFNSKVLIVRVMETALSVIEEINYRSERLTLYLKDFKPEFFFPKSNHITLVLKEFIEEKRVNLLVLIPHHNNLWERIFIKSETKDMIFNADIPLLILPEIQTQH